jgi:hypothetical protein
MVFSMKIKFFKSPGDFRKWLEKHHASTRELLVGYYKKSSGRPSMTEKREFIQQEPKWKHHRRSGILSGSTI